MCKVLGRANLSKCEMSDETLFVHFGFFLMLPLLCIYKLKMSSGDPKFTFVCLSFLNGEIGKLVPKTSEVLLSYKVNDSLFLNINSINI